MEKGVSLSIRHLLKCTTNYPRHNGIRTACGNTDASTAELPGLKEREVPKSEFDYLSFVVLFTSVNCARPDIATAVGILVDAMLAASFM